MNETAPVTKARTYQELMREAIDLMNNFQLHEAEKLFKIITLNFPHETQGWMGLAMTSYDLLKVEAAIEAFRQVGQSAGDWWLSESSVCHMHLVVGNYEKGWQGYMKRSKKMLGNDIPLLDDKNAKEFKHLLILPEQGFGDMIQFTRFFVNLRKSFPHQEITFLCPPPLYRLLKPYCDSLKIELIKQTGDDKVELPVQEGGLVYTHLCSLAAMYNCSMRDVGLPADMALGYDKELATKIRNKLAKKKNKPLIGLCWAGKPEYSKDYRRSLSSEVALKLISDLPQCNFISLTQPIEETAELHAPIVEDPRINCERMTKVEDFYDTASIIMACDMVISVDTACTHLACSLRKPTYLMCAYAPDWRWKLGRNDSPWYPTLRLFRQRKLGNWDNVLEDIPPAMMLDLQRMIAAGRNKKKS